MGTEGVKSSRVQRASKVGVSAGKDVWPVLLTQFLHMIAVGMSGIYYAEVLLDSPYSLGKVHNSQGVELTETEILSRTQTLLSLISMANSICELLSSAFLGVLCDKLGRWQVAILTQTGQFIDFFVASMCTVPFAQRGFHFERSGFAIMVARSVAGLCGNFRVPAMCCMADLSTPETVGKNFGFLGAVSGLALIFGPIAAMVLVQTGFLRSVFLASSLMSITNMVIITRYWPKAVQNPSTPWKGANPIELVRSVVGRSATLRTYGIMNFLDAFATSMFLGTMALFTKFRFGWTQANLAPFFLLFGLMMPFQLGVVLPALLKRFSQPQVLKYGYLTSCLAFFLFFLAGLTSSSVLFVLVVFPFTLGFISNPTQTVMANQEVEDWELGRLSGAYSILETTGKTVAPLIAGVVMNRTLQSVFPSFVYLVASAILFPGVVLAFRLGALVEAADDEDPIHGEDSSVEMTARGKLG